MLTKICKACNTEKPLADYCKISKNGDGLNHTCRMCAAIEKRNYRRIHPDRETIEARQRKLEKSKQADTAINRMRKLLDDKLKPHTDHHA